MRLRRPKGRSGEPQRVLAEVDELVADDRLAEAIERLSSANREHRNRLFERRLVDLRSDAFLQGTWPSTRPAWPETVEDRWPGEAIPEVAHEDLSVDLLRSAIWNHGALLVRGMVERDHVDRLVDDIDATFASYDAALGGEAPADLAGWYEPFARDRMSNREQKRGRGAVMTVDSPPAMFDLIETYDHVGVRSLLNEYFGESPMLLSRKCTLRRVDHRGNTGGWHQDGAFMGVDTRSINIWLSLSDCGDDAPGLDVVGRRLWELVPTGTGAFAGWAANPEAAEAVAAGSIVRPIFKPGDALIFDHMNLHRTAIDSGMVHDRYAIETWWLSPSTYGAMTAPAESGYSPRDQIPILY